MHGIESARARFIQRAEFYFEFRLAKAKVAQIAPNVLRQFRSCFCSCFPQRVAIARALVTGPSVLLADEPTGDLDEQNAWAVFELLERLHRTHKLTSLIATHNLALAARCDRILALEHGVLLTRKAAAFASGTPGGEAS